ncbi:MAG: hypothetical protein KAV82_07040 [Phycisphaerae bacterium]|nr:hypothetical protein [Phycisphaerae bacterium]
MAPRNNVIGIMSIMLLVCTGLGYAQLSGVGLSGQDATKSGHVAKPTGEHGAQPGGAASSTEPRRDDSSMSADGRIAPEVYTEVEMCPEGTPYVDDVRHGIDMAAITIAASGVLPRVPTQSRGGVL